MKNMAEVEEILEKLTQKHQEHTRAIACLGTHDPNEETLLI